MLSLRSMLCSKILTYRTFPKALLGNSEYSVSTQPAVQSTEEENERHLKSFETLTRMTKKVRQKKPQKPPFVKNLLVGVFDTDVLAYPELEKDDTDVLEPEIIAVEKLLGLQHMINCNTLSDKNFRQNLSDYKAIGLQVAQLLNGRECYVSESSRFLEVLSSHNLGDHLIYNEQLGVQALNKFANDQLKTKYLTPVMKGESLTAFCATELNLPEISALETKATYSKDEKTWILNGNKAFVVNGTSADVLIVVALTKLIKRDIIKEAKVTLFVVDRDSPGISSTKTDVDGLEIANIRFENTPVPEGNVIGEVNKGDIVLASLLSDFRLSAGISCLTTTKKILKNLSTHILEQSNDANLLYTTDAIAGKIGEIVTNLYAMESILYLTTGLLDTYENQDCEVESAIVKIFSSKSCYEASTAALDIVGAPALSESHWANKLHKDAMRHMCLQETKDNLKIMTSLLGLQYAGVKINDRVKKLRNPLFHTGYILKRMWTNRRQNEDNPKLDLDLWHYLHPSLKSAAEQLEYCVKRLDFGTEYLLARYGPEVVNQHIDLCRYVDAIVDTYVMTACLARASRSYCIGLQHGAFEMLIANVYCSKAAERVKHNILKIYGGESITNDQHYRELTKQFFKSKGYFLKHPLTRNF